MSNDRLTSVKVPVSLRERLKWLALRRNERLQDLVLRELEECAKRGEQEHGVKPTPPIGVDVDE